MDRQHTVSWIRVKCCINVRWIAFEKACNRWMTLKVIQGHHRCCHSIGIYDFLLVFHCKCISILHRFRDINSYLPKSKDVVTLTTPTWGTVCRYKTNTLRAKPCRKFEDCSFSRCEDISWGVIFSLGQVTLTTPPSGTVSYPRANAWYSLQQYKIWRL